MSNLCNTIKAVCGILKGSIIVMSPNGSKGFFYPSADTDVARLAIFKSSILTVPEFGTMTLIGGSYILDDYLFNLSPHQKLKIYFEQGAWLNYTNEIFAEGSDFAYDGEDRHAEQFGIFGSATPTDDMQPRIQAALFSMPVYPGAEPAPPASYGGPYPNLKVRKGKLFLKNVAYFISKTIYITGYQHVICKETSGAEIAQMVGFAPASADNKEIFSMEMVLSLMGIPPFVPAAAFTFDSVITGISFTNADMVGNVNGSFLLTGGAQRCKLDKIYTFGHNRRGIVYHSSSVYFEIGSLSLNGQVDDNCTGPCLEIGYCQGFVIGLLQIQTINGFTAASGKRKKYAHDLTNPNPGLSNLMGVCIYGCQAFHIGCVTGEQLSTLLRIKYSANFFIGPCNMIMYGEAAFSGMGEEMVSIHSCTQYEVGPFSASYFEMLYAIWNDSNILAARCLSGNATLARVGAIHVGGEFEVVDGQWDYPGGLTTQSISLARIEPPADPVNGDTPSAKVWSISAGGLANVNSLYIQSLDKDGASTSLPIAILPPGGTAGSVPNGYTVIFNKDATGSGTHINRYLNIGFGGDVYAQIAINELKVIGSREPAIADVALAVAAPTMEEFNALVASHNTLLASLRAATGHGLIG